MFSGARFNSSDSSTMTTPAVTATTANATVMPAVPMMPRVSVPSVMEPRPKPANITPDAKPDLSGNQGVIDAMVTL